MLAMPQVKLDSSRNGRLDRGVAQVEQLCSARPARRFSDQHRVCREERGEHDDVAQQEYPEAKADDNAFRHQLADGVSDRVRDDLPVRALQEMALPRRTHSSYRLQGGECFRRVRRDWPDQCGPRPRPE